MEGNHNFRKISSQIDLDKETGVAGPFFLLQAMQSSLRNLSRLSLSVHFNCKLKIIILAGRRGELSGLASDGKLNIYEIVVAPACSSIINLQASLV